MFLHLQMLQLNTNHREKTAVQHGISVHTRGTWQERFTPCTVLLVTHIHTQTSNKHVYDRSKGINSSPVEWRQDVAGWGTTVNVHFR